MNDTPDIEFLILANHVEAVNGLLYIAGGGWTDHHRQVRQGEALPKSRLAIGISVLVPWSCTNEAHSLRIRIESQDATVLAQIDAQLNVGRPPHLPPGSEQHAGIAVNADVLFPAPGEYRIVADLNEGQQIKRWPFRVHDRMV